jgi:multiple antibiotic resistance protein
MTFIPLFVVIDAVGNIPVIIALSEGLNRAERKKLINLAAGAAAIVGLFFLFLGQFVLNLLGISLGAFAIAGGAILLILAIRNMTSGHMVETTKEDMLAVVPIGTPLTVGPATITTLLLLASQFPLYFVLISFLLNILIVWISLLLIDQIVKVMGKAGIKVFSRVVALFLAAIAVNMIIHGLQTVNVLPK